MWLPDVGKLNPTVIIRFWLCCLSLVSYLFIEFLSAGLMFNYEICMQDTSRIVDIRLQAYSRPGAKAVMNGSCLMNLLYDVYLQSVLLSFCERRFKNSMCTLLICFTCLLSCFLDCFIFLLGQTYNFTAGVKDVDVGAYSVSWTFLSEHSQESSRMPLDRISVSFHNVHGSEH